MAIPNEGSKNWFWTSDYPDYSSETPQPSPYDKIKPDAKIDWWKNKNPKINDPFKFSMDTKYGVGNWKQTGQNTGVPWHSSDAAKRYDKLNELFGKKPNSWEMISRPGAYRPEDTWAGQENFKSTGIRALTPAEAADIAKRKAEGRYYQKGSSRQLEWEKLQQVAKDVSKKPFNWKGTAKAVGKNIIKHGPRMLGEGLAVWAADETGGAVGRQLGKTPLMTDPKMNYNQFYEDVFTKQAMWDRQNRSPVKDSGYPSPSLGSL